MEGLLDNVRQLSKELRLQMLIINSYIPMEYQELIEQVLLIVNMQHRACQLVSHNALFWKSQTQSVNDSIYDFD